MKITDKKIKEIKDIINNSNGVITPDNYFVQVPNSFIRNSELTIQEKIIYIYLWGFGGNKSYGYPSQAKMVKELNMSRATITKFLKSLEDKGGIYIINRYKKDKGQTTNIYYLMEIDVNTGGFIKQYLDILKEVYPTKTTII